MLSHMWNVKNKLENTTKQISQICKTNQWSTVEEERGANARQRQGIKRYKVQGIKLTTKICCTAQGVQAIFYSNYSVFKSC